MNRVNESLKYVSLLFQIKDKRIRYIESVFRYMLTKHPKSITFPEMIINLYNVKLVSRKNTQDSAFLSKLYEKELTRYLLYEKPTFFIDVGAHIGRFSVLLAKNGSKVLSIEPSSDNYRQLNKNIQFNNLKNVKTLNIGCSDKKSIGKLKLTKGYTGQNTFLNTENENKNIENITLRRLDEVITKNIYDKKIIIKIDVEGFEIKVLKGMKEILKNKNPIVIAEISNEEDRKEIVNFLKLFNYRNTLILDGRNFVFKKIR